MSGVKVLRRPYALDLDRVKCQSQNVITQPDAITNRNIKQAVEIISLSIKHDKRRRINVHFINYSLAWLIDIMLSLLVIRHRLKS